MLQADWRSAAASRPATMRYGFHPLLVRYLHLPCESNSAVAAYQHAYHQESYLT